MFNGNFTATEAAAIGAAGSIGIALFKRELTWAKLHQCLLETIRTSCMVMTIVAGAVIFGRFLAITQVPTGLAGWLGGLPLPGWGIMGLIIVFYFIAGCFIDALAVNLLTIPIFYPVVNALHYDLIWFGVIIVLVTQMGVITPPVGINVYVVSGMARDIPMEKIFRGCIPFLIAMIIGTIVLMIFPQLALFLPSLIK
jgi:tripartite ATP-independent transporter DctM subunit